MPEQGKRANQIFISYRRDDSAAITGRIYDRLLQKFGRDVIFKDVDSIPLGVNFRKHIDSIIAECAVVLVVIGDRWVGIADESGRPRLQDPRDFVRIEIESALRREVPVVPLLVHHAEMPDDESLPESLRELADRNGMSIGHDPHFHVDINRLISNLETILAPPPAETTAHNLTGETSGRARTITAPLPAPPPTPQTAPLAASPQIKWYVRGSALVTGFIMSALSFGFSMDLWIRTYDRMVYSSGVVWSELFGFVLSTAGSALVLWLLGGIYVRKWPGLKWRWGVWLSALPVYLILTVVIVASSESLPFTAMNGMFIPLGILMAIFTFISACLGAHLDPFNTFRASKLFGSPSPLGGIGERLLTLAGLLLLTVAGGTLMYKMFGAPRRTVNISVDTPATTNTNANNSNQPATSANANRPPGVAR